MSMIMCPECGTSISSKARTCTHCGFISSDVNKPISEQDTYQHLPVIKYEIQRWDPQQNIVESELVNAAPSDNKTFMQFFGNWEYIRTTLPSLADLIMKMATGEHETRWVAKISDYYKKLIDEGTLRLVLDKNGEILPTIFGKERFVKQVRLEQIQVPADLTQAMQHLETQAALSLVLAEVHSVNEEIKQLESGLQNDRLAMAESAWDKLMQARAIADSRLRETYILQAISSATDAKRTLMRNFTEKKQYIEAHSGKPLLGLLKDSISREDSSIKAEDSLQDLVAITNAVRVEGEGYLMLVQMGASKECLVEFRDFITDNKLDDRDTLLMIGMNLKQGSKLDNVIDQFSDIAQRAIDLNELDEYETVPKKLLSAFIPMKTDTEDEEKDKDTNVGDDAESSETLSAG